jgi:hypothetical protein
VKLPRSGSAVAVTWSCIAGPIIRSSIGRGTRRSANILPVWGCGVACTAMRTSCASFRQAHSWTGRTHSAQAIAVGFVGSLEGPFSSAECCGQLLCDKEEQYVMFSYSREFCDRSHRRYTACGSHAAEGHEGVWQVSSREAAGLGALLVLPSQH